MFRIEDNKSNIKNNSSVKEDTADNGVPKVSGEKESSNIRAKLRPSPLAYPQDTRYGTFAKQHNNNNNNNNYLENVKEKSEHDKYNSNVDEMENREYEPHTRMSLWEYVTSPQSPLVQIRDHCHQQWIAVVITIVLFMWSVYFVFQQPNQPSPFGLSGSDKCATPFGTWLGSNNGVAAYSNCNHGYVAEGHPRHSVLVDFKEVYTGWEWVAVEYARRYWVMRRLITFAPIETPSDIFNLTFATGVAVGAKNKKIPLEHYYNHLQNVIVNGANSVVAVVPDNDANVMLTKGKMTDEGNYEKVTKRGKKLLTKHSALSVDNNFVLGASPIIEEGDLIIYGSNAALLPGGHVAVVVGVNGPLYNNSRVEHDTNELTPATNTNTNTNTSTFTTAYYTIEVAEQNWYNEKWSDVVDTSTNSHALLARLESITDNISNNDNNVDNISNNINISHALRYDNETVEFVNTHADDIDNNDDNVMTNNEHSTESTLQEHASSQQDQEDAKMTVRRAYARTLLLKITRSTTQNVGNEMLDTKDISNNDDDNNDINNVVVNNNNITVKEKYSLIDDANFDIIGWLRPEK